MSKFSFTRIFGRSSKNVASSDSSASSASGSLDGASGAHAAAAGGSKTPEDGIHVSPQGVLHLQGDNATLALHGGARHQVMMQNAGSGITVSLISSPHPGAAELRYAKEFALVQASAAQAMFAATVTAWHRTLWMAPEAASAASLPYGGPGGPAGRTSPQDVGAGPRRSTWLLVLGGALSAVVLMTGVGMLMAPPSAATAAASGTSGTPGTPGTSGAVLGGGSPLQVPVAPVAPVAAAAPAAPGQTYESALAEAQSRLQQARLPAAELSRVNASAHRIQVREGSSVLSAFSDPNCPACQELEREAATLKAGQGFAVIPVGFQPGSRVLAARVLCAKDPARAWADAMRGIAPTEPPCDAGLRKVDENNNLFGSIGASATPTLVAANGQMAQGAASGAQLQVFASTYAK